MRELYIHHAMDFSLEYIKFHVTGLFFKFKNSVLQKLVLRHGGPNIRSVIYRRLQGEEEGSWVKFPRDRTTRH